MLRDHRVDRLAQRLARGAFAAPAERLDPGRVQAHHRDVALPAPVAAREGEPHAAGREADAGDGHLGDLAHRDVVAGGDVVDRERRGRLFVREEHSAHHVVDVDVRLRLAAVAQDAQRDRLLARRHRAQQRPREVEADAVGLARADHVAEAEGAAGQAEHRRVAGDQRLARELAGPVGRHGDQRAVVLDGLVRAEIAVHAAARRVEDPLRAGRPHRLQHALGQRRPLPEVDGRLGGGARDVGIRGQVDDDVMARHRRRQRAGVLGVAADDTQARVARMVREVPFASGREVVVHGHARGAAVGREQVIAEVAAEETGASDDEETLTRRLLRHRRRYYRHFLLPAKNGAAVLASLPKRGKRAWTE